MAVSSSISELLTARGIITAAMQDIGVHSLSQGAISGEAVDLGIRVLNFMLKEWQADGCNLWRAEEQTVTIAAGVNEGVPDPRMIDVSDVSVKKAGGFEQKLARYEWGQYLDLPNKAAPGQYPTLYAPRTSRDGLAVRVWPVPVQDIELSVSGARVIADVASANDNVDAPQEWTACIVSNLGARLCDAYGVVDSNVALIRRSAQSYQQMRAFDRPASYYLFSARAWP